MKKAEDVRITKNEADRVAKICTILKKEYPDAFTSLSFQTPFQLLIATILSAQCTDKQVNIVTKELFEKYPDAVSMAQADIRDIKRIIHPTGFYNNKAKHIHATAKLLAGIPGGNARATSPDATSEIPDTMDGLLKLPGVARKTANVVLGSAFGKTEGVVVDTHVQRISRRLGLTNNKNPERIEQDLMLILPRKDWIWFAHSLVLFGRKTCTARKPKCGECPFNDSCPSAFTFK